MIERKKIKYKKTKFKATAKNGYVVSPIIIITKVMIMIFLIIAIVFVFGNVSGKYRTFFILKR